MQINKKEANAVAADWPKRYQPGEANMSVASLPFYKFGAQRKITPLYPTYEDYERSKKKIYAQNIPQQEKDYQIRCLIEELEL
jgi:hypothetical protein